jgi:MSHA type pilus biogenesis protein MshL
MKVLRTVLWLWPIVVIGAGCAPRTAQTPPVAAPTPPVAVAPPLPELPAVQIEQQPIAATPRQLYSIAVEEANIRDVLLTLGKTTNFSFVLAPGVEGMITVDLKQVTLEEMLTAMLSPIGLVYEREGNLIRVSRPKVETRIFTVNYIASIRSGTSGLSATAGATGGGTGSAGSAGNVGQTGGAVGGGAGRGGGGSTSSVGSTDTVDLWGELEESLATFLSTDGKMVLSQTAGLVAVTDYPPNVIQVARYLELVQGAVQRQVMIEAQILEVTLSKDFSAGIDWSLIPYNLGLPGVGLITGTLAGGALASLNEAPASSSQVGVAAPQRGIQALISALERQGEVSILSSPKVSTLNNQKAVIKVATDDVFFTQTTQREPLTGVVTQIVTPNTITEGLVLDVTPQIGEDAITMNIRPSISERLGEARSPTGDVVPILAIRATDTVVRVRNSQTVVIGGLMQRRASRTRSGVPGLQRAPIVGRAFRSDTETESKVELVILLTPTLLVGRADSELTPRELQLLREAGALRR